MPSIPAPAERSDDSHASWSSAGEQESPRKRRRLSSSEADDARAQPQPSSSSLPALSRVKSKSKPPAQARRDEDVPDSIQAAIDSEDNISFATLGVTPWLVASLANMAIKRPTGIQKRCIPEILKGRDCIGGSRTGSGKTVAFAVPILQKWAEDPSAIYALILTPTRELALQLYEQVLAISAPQSLKSVLVTGGTDMRSQAIALAQRPHIVVATPGRLADHINTSGHDTICGLSRCRFLVLDEADRLLAPGKGSMLPDVEACIGVLPPPADRQTCLFTATVTDEVRALKSQPRPKGRPPVFTCELEPSTTGGSTNSLAREIPPTLKQTYLQAPVTHRESYLHALLTTPINTEHPAIIIFCNRTSTATLLEYVLRLLEHRVTALHSGLPQQTRTSNLARFRARAARILVATDVAARGLDIPHVALVIHFDLPRDPDDYVHRVGRTARAGREGESVAIVGQRDVELLLAIEERVGKKMEEWSEEGVSVEGRVVRNFITTVSTKKREAMLAIEEGRDVKGKRKHGLEKKR